ncbi:hypothetical protein D3C78_1140200 [compost metagenome]
MRQFRQAQDRQLAVLVLELAGEGGADHLLRRYAVDLLGEHAHERHFAAGNDVGLEAVGAQVVEEFQHRLEHHLGVGLAAARMLGAGQPAFGVFAEGFGRHVGVGGADDLQQALHAAGGQGFAVTFQQRLERLLFLPLRVLRGHALDLIESEQHLEIHRLLAPQGAIVVEHRDPLGHGDEVLAALGSYRADECLDGLARWPVTPGRQDFVRRLREQGQHQQQ